MNRARPSPPPSRIDAVSRGVPAVIERVSDALKMCRVPGEETGSILFGAEKEPATARVARLITFSREGIGYRDGGTSRVA